MARVVLLLVFVSLTGSVLHPLHVSVTEIEYDEKDKAFEIMIRVFADDLETTLKNRYNDPALDVLNPSKPLDEMMKAYLAEKFVIDVDRKRQALNYLGHERDADSFVFYVEVPRVKKWKSIAVRNTVLMETFEDQSNLVHITSGGVVRSLRLTRSNPSGVPSFE